MDNRGNCIQNTLFGFLFLLAVLISWSTLFAPIHEQSHQYAYHRQGLDAEIIDWNKTQVPKLIVSGVFAGYLGEFIFFFVLALIVFFISSPTKQGIRKYYAHLGFPWGYCNGIFIAAFWGTDFTCIRGETTLMTGTWFLICIPTLLIGWLVLWKTRLYKPLS